MTVRLIPDATTQVKRLYLVDVDDIIESATPIPNAGTPFEFDEETNATTWADIQKDYRPYTIVSGELQKNGSPVTINPDGEAESIRKGLANRIQAARNY